MMVYKGWWEVANLVTPNLRENMRTSWSTIREVLREPLYRKIAWISALIFLLFNLWLITRTTTLASTFTMAWNGDYFSSFAPDTARVVSVTYEIFFWLLTLVSTAVFGIAAALLALLFKNSKGGKARESGLGVGGTLAALFSAGCPICGTFLLSLVGVAGGIGIFPLKGLELKVLSFGLMLGSVAFASKRLADFKASGCENGLCEVEPHPTASPPGERMKKGLVWAITILLAVNQFMIGAMVPSASGAKLGGLSALFGVHGAAAKEIIAPKLNPDGQTTSLIKQPTITEVPAEPKGMDPIEAAKAVMLATGKPFYAPDDISFDDPINAQNKWGVYERSIALDPDLEARYQKLINEMVCSYCCGGPARVTRNKQCGCAHAKAVRGFYRYMLQNYGSEYTDEQLLGESHRWYALWYPKGMVEDYLLATGRVDAMGHQNHGGAGADGMHGMTAQ